MGNSEKSEIDIDIATNEAGEPVSEGEQLNSDTANINRIKLRTHSSSSILDIANNQYSVQWARLSTLQQSASSVLVLISIIFAIMLGVLTQADSELSTKIAASLGALKSSFYISIIFSLIYLGITLYYVFGVLWPKKIKILKNPQEMSDLLWQEVEADYTQQFSICPECSATVGFLLVNFCRYFLKKAGVNPQSAS